ncbi:hypothetical protein [Chengkuizengella axinellae]|uniref:Uncharacterized protein n=1 Tax=Chengkuizengella axinellae TaxID=3064388 RepID=A0ABT9J3D4_9BACL|nr:hypothetical protein [Chengkuizengella sp. 2205SS18-9]MDP5275504.1 hypothetical protein [Chengkuizengella sp. 2205SS18-9]
MSAFDKCSNIVCDFKDETEPVNLVAGADPVTILEVTVCVKDKNKTVKLDWSVNETLFSEDVDPIFPIEVNPNATVEYILCNNDQQIGPTVTSSHSINNMVDITSPSVSGAQTLSFTHESQPNFTFCDEQPFLGNNSYQVKASLLNPDSGATNSANLFDRSLVAVCFSVN